MFTDIQFTQAVVDACGLHAPWLVTALADFLSGASVLFDIDAQMNRWLLSADVTCVRSFFDMSVDT
jgi:hypothetical protein